MEWYWILLIVLHALHTLLWLYAIIRMGTSKGERIKPAPYILALLIILIFSEGCWLIIFRKKIFRL